MTAMALSLPVHRLTDDEHIAVTSISLSSTGSLFSTASLEHGWHVYSLTPLELTFASDASTSTRVQDDGALAQALPLWDDSNIVALVGLARVASPRYPPNKLMLFDCASRCIIASLEFSQPVLRCLSRADELIVILRDRVCVFTLGHGERGIRRESTHLTCDNPKGAVPLLLCIFSPSDNRRRRPGSCRNRRWRNAARVSSAPARADPTRSPAPYQRHSPYLWRRH